MRSFETTEISFIPPKNTKTPKEVGLTDAKFFWDLTKTLTGQLLASAATG